MKFVFLTGHGSKIDYATGALEAENLPSQAIADRELIETLNRLTEGPHEVSDRDG
jgi:hypothetical protein